MVPQDLESKLRKDPFQPFRIVTTTGKSYDITDRDRPLLLVGKRTVVIGLRVPESDPYFDRTRWCPWFTSSASSRFPRCSRHLESGFPPRGQKNIGLTPDARQTPETQTPPFRPRSETGASRWES
jgi:hypothetical protein